MKDNSTMHNRNVQGVKKNAGSAPPTKATNIFHRLLPVLIIILVGVIIYANSLDCSFHLDDHNNIIENEAIRDISDIGSIVGYAPSRTVGVISFALNYHFHKLDLTGYHIVNLVIHICASLAVWWLVSLILATPEMKGSQMSRQVSLISTGSALLFLTHPLQTQAVTYIVQRYTSLAALFYLMAMCFYLNARKSSGNRKYPWFSAFIMTAFLGLFTKEIVFTLPLTILTIEIFFITGTGILKNKVLWISGMAFTAFVVVFFMVSPYDISQVFEPKTSMRYLDPPITSMLYLVTQFRVLVTYIRLMFIPSGQHLEYDYAVSHQVIDPAAIMSLLVLLAILAGAVRLYKNNRLVSFGIFWFFITLTIESTIIPLEDVIFEHRLYLPMVGFALMIMGGPVALMTKQHYKAVIVILVSVLLVFSSLTIRRNHVWKSDISLLEDSVSKSPGSARAHNNLALMLEHVGRRVDALRHYEESIRLKPNYSAAHNNIARMYIINNNLKLAELHNLEAIRIKPDFAKAYSDLGSVYGVAGNTGKAKESYNKAIEIDATFMETYINLGKLLTEENDIEGAKDLYRSALEIDNNVAEIHFNLSVLLEKEGLLNEAMEHYYEVLRINGDTVEVHFNLGNISLLAGKIETAKEHLRKVLEIDPTYIKAIVNLGSIAYSEGNTVEAKAFYIKALKVDPNDAMALQSLRFIDQQEKTPGLP
ncbi:tetratricopeptide repeat protein [Candidatus Latescibacterota bacterium]